MAGLIHEGRPWLEKTLTAANAHSLYIYGCKYIENRRKSFYRDGKNKIEPYHVNYEPNPFEFQYDLELWIFLNYDEIQKQEGRRLREWFQAEEEKPNPDEVLIARLKKKHERCFAEGPTGIPRHEHLFNAAEIRWPSEVDGRAIKGELVRDPWAVKRYELLAKKENYIANFGGGGQGKTWTYLAFALMIFEFYLFTRSGAKCSLSTVNETKMLSVFWPHILKLHSSTREGISKTAGRSLTKGFGKYTIGRPGTEDTGGVFRGILIGRNIDQSLVTDKLTGTHGHESYIYIVDEAQSTPMAPIEASANYMASGTPAWVILLGNYDKDDDSLGLNVRPIAGWNSVDKDTERWKSIIHEVGAKCNVLHLNNENCPAVIDNDLSFRFPHLPNIRKRDRKHPPSSRHLDNKGYRRFWVGYRSDDLEEDRCLTQRMIEKGGAHKPLKLDPEYPINNFLSFDGAQAQVDRNIVGVFADGYDPDTEEWVWGLKKPLEQLRDAADIKDYFSNSAKQLHRLMIKNDVKSGDLVLDWSNYNAHVAMLRQMGMETYPIVYSQNVPDGTAKRKGEQPEPKIIVNPDTMEYAHEMFYNRITLGAYALRTYVIQGRVRGMNPDMMAALENDRTFEEEMFCRNLEVTQQKKYGEVVRLDDKKELIKKKKFSPDLLDVWFQAAYYMFVKRGMPFFNEYDEVLHKKARLQEVDYLKRVEEGESLLDEMNDIWDDGSSDGLEYVEMSSGYIEDEDSF